MTRRQQAIADWLSKNHPKIVRAYAKTEVTDKSVVDLLRKNKKIAESTYWRDVNIEKIMAGAKSMEEFDRPTDPTPRKCGYCGSKLS